MAQDNKEIKLDIQWTEKELRALLDMLDQYNNEELNDIFKKISYVYEQEYDSYVSPENREGLNW